MRSTGGVLVAAGEPGPCPRCGAILHVQKTRRRLAFTLDLGHFIAREALHVCVEGCLENGKPLTRRATSGSSTSGGACCGFTRAAITSAP